MLKLVAAAFLGASKSASANLGLGAPSRDPSVAPCAEDTGGNGWCGGFGDVDGLLQLPMVLARLLVRVVLRSHFEMVDWVDLVLFGEHLSIVRHVLLGTDLQASERLSA